MRKWILFLLLPSAMGLFSGCDSENPTEQQMTDEEAIEAFIAESDWFKLLRYYEGEAVPDTADTVGLKVACELPILWGREITGASVPSADVQLRGDSAFVSVEVSTVGILHLMWWLADTGWVHIEKPLGETSTLSAIFVRTGSAASPGRGWELALISGAEGVSGTVCTMQIQSVHISSDSYPDTTIDDPLELFDPEQLLTFAPGEEVQLTVTANDDTARLFLHVFWNVWPWHLRVPFSNDGGGSYSGQWRAQLIPAVRFAVFDMLHHETLYDETYPYDCNTWLFPYMVTSEESW